jgi:hypothetical protein
MTDHLTSRSQRLIDEFKEGESIREGIANVLRHLACVFDEYCDCDDASLVGVPVATLESLADELAAPTLLQRALDGDCAAARQFLQEFGFIDANGQLMPPYRPVDLNDD